MGAFTHDGAHFVLENVENLKLANRNPAGDDAFLDRISAASKYTAGLTRRQTVAWLVARLNYLTGGEVQTRFGDRNSDGGRFLLPLTVVDVAERRPIGIFDLECHRDRIILRGGRDSLARDPRTLFVRALVAEPDWLEPCRIRVFDPEARENAVWYCGWDAGQFIVG